VDEPALNITAASDLEFALHLADVAARVTVPAFGARLPVVLKGDATPVTEVDLGAERAIRDEVAATFPGDGVLGEEGGLDPGTTGRVWVVDPIDGTRLYAEGIPLWATLIALRERGEVVLGVADLPPLRERYRACTGGGAWRADERLLVSEIGSLEEAFVVHSPVEGWPSADALWRLATAARATRGLSDAWGQLLVARGSADVLIEREPCAEWDWAAPGLIVREAGGRVTALDGAEPTAGRGLLVTNGRLHEQALTALDGPRVSGVSAGAGGGSAPRRARSRTS
jgi:histidinol-phosphatase